MRYVRIKTKEEFSKDYSITEYGDFHLDKNYCWPEKYMCLCGTVIRIEDDGSYYDEIGGTGTIIDKMISEELTKENYPEYFL